MATAKIDKEAIKQDLLANPNELGIKTRLALKYGCSRQYLGSVAQPLIAQGLLPKPVTGRKPRQKALAAPKAISGDGLPTFEELVLILENHQGAVDKIIRVIVQAKKIPELQEELEKYKRGYNLMMETSAANEKKDKKRNRQKQSYELAVQKGELPNFTEHISLCVPILEPVININ